MCDEENSKLDKLMQDDSGRMMDIKNKFSPLITGQYTEYPNEMCNFCNKKKGLRYKHRKLSIYRIICKECLEELQLTKQWL